AAPAPPPRGHNSPRSPSRSPAPGRPGRACRSAPAAPKPPTHSRSSRTRRPHTRAAHAEDSRHRPRPPSAPVALQAGSAPRHAIDLVPAASCVRLQYLLDLVGLQLAVNVFAHHRNRRQSAGANTPHALETEPPVRCRLVHLDLELVLKCTHQL